MTITKLTASAVTYGGYVNVSRQDIDFSSPAIMDIVINDLAAQYAIQTEAAAFTTFDAAATAGTTIATGAATAAGVMTSLWAAVSKVYTASKGAGQVFAITGPDMLADPRAAVPARTTRRTPSRRVSLAGDFGTGLDRQHQRGPAVRVGRLRHTPDPRHVDRRRRGVRGPDRLAAGRRAVGARRAGRVRRLLHADDGRRDLDHRRSSRRHERAGAEGRGGTEWDAPNQQVVRADESAPWDEGTGGAPDEPAPVATVAGPPPAADLDAMTKAELLELARELGVSPANGEHDQGRAA